MLITIDELITRARTYVDDDHRDETSWILPEMWLALFNVEYATLFRKWVRAGLVGPTPVDVALVGNPATLSLKQASIASPIVASTVTIYDGTIGARTLGSGGVGLTLSMDTSGPTSGALTTLVPGVSELFSFSDGVTTYADLEAALAGSALFTVLTPSATPTATMTGVGFQVDSTTVGGLVPSQSILAIVGVAEDLDSYKRVLRPAQSQLGRAPFWSGTGDVGKSDSWEASGFGGDLLITLHPSDSSGSYIVRYIARPATFTSTDSSIEVPEGGDERIVLGMARRAHLKDSAASRLLDSLLFEADAELGWAAFSSVNGDSPRVRRVGRPNPYMPYLGATGFVNDPRTYRYF